MAWCKQLIDIIMPSKGVLESDEMKVLWDFMIQYDHHKECRKPGIFFVEKEEKKCLGGEDSEV